MPPGLAQALFVAGAYLASEEGLKERSPELPHHLLFLGIDTAALPSGTQQSDLQGLELLFQLPLVEGKAHLCVRLAPRGASGHRVLVRFAFLLYLQVEVGVLPRTRRGATPIPHGRTIGKLVPHLCEQFLGVPMARLKPLNLFEAPKRLHPLLGVHVSQPSVVEIGYTV